MFGKVVILKHNGGLETVYAHNSELLVKVGDRIDEGRVISRVGTTGRSTVLICILK
jgi:murein DD-endopeptidase MepM/ murein hydrolase activator NlpD